MGKKNSKSNSNGILGGLFKKRSLRNLEMKAADTVLAEVTKDPEGSVIVSDQFGNKFSSIPEFCNYHGIKFEYFKEVKPGVTIWE